MCRSTLHEEDTLVEPTNEAFCAPLPGALSMQAGQNQCVFIVYLVVDDTIT